MQATKDLRKVSLWLGHASMLTTEMYTRIDHSVSIGLLCRTGDTNPVVKDCLGFTARIFEDLHCEIAMRVR